MNEHRDNVENSPKIMDIAAGVLVGLRGCTQQRAFDELADAAHRTGIGAAALSDALVALASGSHATVPNRDAALQQWGQLLSARSAAQTSEDDPSTVGPQTKVLHGGVDASTIC